MTDAPWPVKTLGEVLTLAYGKPLEARDRDENGPIPVYGANGVKAKSRRSLVAGPSIIVGRKGSAGELNVCKGPFWPLDVTYYVEHDSKETDLLFLYYLLSLMDLPRLAKGVKPGINRNEVYALTAPVPPLKEQKRIAALLDDATARIDELAVCYERARTHANNLFTSALRAELEGNPDWPVKTLGELFDFQNGRGFKKSEWSKSGLPIIRIQNLNSESAPYNYFAGTFDPRILVEDGNLLFSWSGSIGTSFGPHIWQRSSGLLNQHVFKVYPKVPIETSYAHYCLRVITAEIERSVSGAVGLVHITKEKLNRFEIPVPTLEEQKRIVARLDQMRAKTVEMVAAYDAKLQAAKNLRQSILEAAFAGEL